MAYYDIILAKNWRAEKTMGSAFGKAGIEREDACIYSEAGKFLPWGQWAVIVDHS